MTKDSLYNKIEVNNKLFKILMISIGFLSILSIVFINYFKLDQPVFFEHYFDLRSYNEGTYHEEMPFILRYITNVDDSRKVSRIGFPEYPDALVQGSEDEYMSEMIWGYGSTNLSNDNYGRYSIRTVFCNIIDLPESAYYDSIITKALIGFNDGSEMLIDIGALHLYKAERGKDILEDYYGSSSSDGVSETKYNVLEDITFQSIESPLLGQFSDQVILEINDMDIAKATGIAFESGEQINIKSQIQSTEDIIKDYTIFGIHPKLKFSAENGRHHTERIYNINNMYDNDYSFMNLYRYIKERQGI